MPPAGSSMEIYKLLDKSNCRECGAATCLAFSVLAFKGEKRLEDCPYLDDGAAGKIGLKDRIPVLPEQTWEEALERLKREMAGIDFQQAAEKLDARFVGGSLAIRCFGKEFVIDSDGNLRSGCHVNRWVHQALLGYIISGRGADPSGKWVPFGGLKGGRDWNPLYSKMCEEELKKLADSHTDLFFDVLSVFGGKRPEDDFSADRALIVHPLPKVPLLICYWEPEDDFESKLNVLYDSAVEDNLRIEALYVLATGITAMMTRIIRTHG